MLKSILSNQKLSKKLLFFYHQSQAFSTYSGQFDVILYQQPKNLALAGSIKFVSTRTDDRKVFCSKSFM
ncbi:hypothetical protein N482_24455 [Pseudoalteromonas luteoviolacea NCIMB 1942]|uniref:Uncharacterized protein n=1 Tax=Pseudoalteromonas luteoviolacea NCIMB 1942 TaxID=1365253 RepID=A0A167G9Y8_9GAMM|nr:hypothetical protein N482_24455 [Pseudoalteromonas luteoviolacea NCIMB 1942]